MIIDCDSCTVRGAACTDCVVTFLTIPVRAEAKAEAGAGPDAPGGPRSTGGSRAPGTRPDGASGAVGAAPVDLDDDERAAIDVLALSGLVPPLRMARAR